MNRKLEVLKIELFSIIYHIPRMLPGYYFSNKVRAFILRFFLKKIGKNIIINRDVVFESPENIILGNNVGINTRCWISGGGGVKIGDNTIIGPHVVIHSANHQFSRKDIPINIQGHLLKEIIIKDDVWIGANSTILAGVTINRGCIIAAGAVITKDTIEYGIYGGVPAKLISIR